MPIPWSQVILHGPKVLDAATTLWDKWNSRPRPQAIDPNAESMTQMEAVLQRLQQLEEAQAASAELEKNMAQQIASLTAGYAELSRKATMAIWTAAGALVVAFIAVGVALAR
ncbi:hypothetical protein GCM10027343_25170 [Noviherbaspirillum agri]